jgi:hypothetical protein
MNDPTRAAVQTLERYAEALACAVTSPTARRLADLLDAQVRVIVDGDTVDPREVEELRARCARLSWRLLRQLGDTAPRWLIDAVCTYDAYLSPSDTHERFSFDGGLPSPARRPGSPAGRAKEMPARGEPDELVCFYCKQLFEPNRAADDDGVYERFFTHQRDCEAQRFGAPKDPGEKARRMLEEARAGLQLIVGDLDTDE